MNYTTGYLGATDSTAVVEGVQTAAGSTSSVAGAIISIKSTVDQWEKILESATTAYDQAVARNKIADLRLELARLEAQEAEGRRWLYFAGIGAGVLLLGGFVIYGVSR